jgi:hypothetical protein
VFGAVEAICIETNAARLRSRWGKLRQALAAYPLVICDDDSKEIADFIGVDPAVKRLLFLHGKANRTGVGRYHVDTLQEVGRQATASLAFPARTRPPEGWEAMRWSGTCRPITSLSRAAIAFSGTSTGLPANRSPMRCVRHGDIRPVRVRPALIGLFQLRP